MLWVDQLKGATKATACFDRFFPDLATACDMEDWFARHSAGTWQNLAWNLQHEAAVRILAAFISGPMWAYLLIRWPNDDLSLLKRPDDAVKLASVASVASVRFSLAPMTERERSRMLYELENGNPDEYPSEEHFEEAKEWLEAAVHLPTTPEAIAARIRVRDAASPVPVKRELVQGPSLAEIPNSSARRRRRGPEAEGTPEGPERRRVKLEP
jgi:hypothetical protein